MGSSANGYNAGNPPRAFELGIDCVRFIISACPFEGVEGTVEGRLYPILDDGGGVITESTDIVGLAWYLEHDQSQLYRPIESGKMHAL